MANKRILFATHAVGIAPLSSTSYTAVHGVQSVGITPNFTLENIMELGQLSIYQLVEQIPEIEVTAEKCLDGYPTLYHLSTQNSTANTLIARSNQRCQLAMSVYSDAQSAATGTPTSESICSGLYWQQISLNFSTDTPFKESMTWVGNDKFYKSSNFDFEPAVFGSDQPFAIAGSGGVQIRRDFIFYPIGGGWSTQENDTSLDTNGQVAAFLTILPPDIVGISSSGTNDRDSSGEFGAHITDITVSVNVGRDAILELGRKDPYYRFATFPIPVTTQITTVATDADTISATETGYDGLGNNVKNRSIRIRIREGTFLNLGTSNKLQTTSFAGGNSDGGNAMITYSYINYDDFYYSHPQDPGGWPYPY